MSTFLVGRGLILKCDEGKRKNAQNSLDHQTRNAVSGMWTANTHFMFQHGIFSFSILTNDNDVNILMMSCDSSIRFAMNHINEQIQLISNSYVTGYNAGIQTFGLDIACDY